MTDRGRAHYLRVLSTRDGWCCYYCGIVLSPADARIEHRVPRSRGGAYALSNLVLACDRCDEEKASLTDSEYRQWLERREGNPDEPRRWTFGQ